MSHQGEKVDIIAEAYRQAKTTQASSWRMYSAPAKVNLYLEVGSRQPDGYHPVDTVLHSLALHDTLAIRSCKKDAGGLEVDLQCKTAPGIDDIAIPTKDNLVYKACHALYEACAIQESYHIDLVLTKQIPAQSGLGGGSSDAAAALLAAADVFGISKDDPRLVSTAQQLGCDVPFFLKGGCAHYTGRGDVFVRALAPLQSPLVIVRPQEGVSTGQAYAAFDQGAYVIDPSERRKMQLLADAQDVPLCNNLCEVASQLNPEIHRILEQLSQGSQHPALVSGSGSACYVLCGSYDEASARAREARKMGWWARVSFLSSQAACAL